MVSGEKNLRSSANYVWCTSDNLGKGATGNVYQGMNKETGELVAVKTFNEISRNRPPEVQRREYEVLSRINHENIVKLIAIEEELTAQDRPKVIIMELCTGGSLFSILDDSANTYGLEEKEFLLVLKHLAAGMKHLRDMNIIHRDLKPGNIMRFIGDAGQSIYKLTDFGAARELAEGQQFVSLYGTEEYLHPEMYAKAVLQQPYTQRSFGAKVDLWSIGVTLFHVATGLLPFRPHGGRRNREMMHRITTEKKRGIISGVQHSENGDIEWHSTLPETCRLSPSLKDKITPLLVDLLDCSPENTSTFEHFFQAATHISTLKKAHVFYMNGVIDFSFYVHPDERISDLKARLSTTKSVHVPLADQLMICNKRKLLDDELILSATRGNTIILIDSKASGIRVTDSNFSGQFKFPDLPKTTTAYTGEQDAQITKTCSAISFRVLQDSNRCLSHCNIINQIPQQILSLIEDNLQLLNEKRESCSSLIDSLKDQTEYVLGTTINLAKCLNRIDPDALMDANKQITQIRASLHEELENNWRDFGPKFMDLSKRVDELNELELDEHISRISSNHKQIDNLCLRIRESWLYLHKNKGSPFLDDTEIQLHSLEKRRVEANCNKLLHLCKDNHQSMEKLAAKLDSWYNDAHATLLQSDCLSEELNLLLEGRDKVLMELDDAIESQHQQWQKLMRTLDQSKDSVSPLSDATNKKNGLPTNNQMKTNGQTENTVSTLLSNQLLDLSRGQDYDLIEEIHNLQETQRLLCNSLSENQNLFSELVSITISAKKVKTPDEC